MEHVILRNVLEHVKPIKIFIKGPLARATVKISTVDKV